jgi:hypothetical protein
MLSEVSILPQFAMIDYRACPKECCRRTIEPVCSLFPVFFVRLVVQQVKLFGDEAKPLQPAQRLAFTDCC